MSLPTSDLEFISSKVSDGFTGLQIAAVIGEFCSVYDLSADYRPQGRTESKAKFVHRVFRMFDTEFQIALARYFVEKSPKLKEDRIVQQLLARLACDYGEVSLSEEELEKRSELEYLLEPYPDILDLWQRVEVARISYRYRECLDNSRLALELLLHELLGNTSRLEEQRRPLKRALDDLCVDEHVRNMLTQSFFDNFVTTQNNNVKHHDLPDGFTELEVRFVVEQTMTFMIYLIKKLALTD